MFALIEVLTIIIFIALLIMSLVMIFNFYICDNNNCKAFTDAQKKGEPGTKQYVLALLSELYDDGIWPFPYIGATILTPLSLWFVGAPITVKNFAIMFLTSFIIIYFLFAFFGHHYVKYIAQYTADYIQNNCTSNNPAGVIYNEGEEVNAVCNQELESNKGSIESLSNNLGVSFAIPVNIF